MPHNGASGYYDFQIYGISELQENGNVRVLHFYNYSVSVHICKTYLFQSTKNSERLGVFAISIAFSNALLK